MRMIASFAAGSIAVRGRILPGLITAVAFALWLAAFPATAASMDPGRYPQRPIRIVVGFAPGSGADITARYVAKGLSASLKQPVVVDNRPGAAGTLAALTTVRASPDGYTLLSVSSAYATAPAIYEKLHYDARKDLSGISLTATSKFLLVVAPSLGVTSLQGLLALARSNPGRLSFSSAGRGSATHFAAAQFQRMAKIDVVHTPFKGIHDALAKTMTAQAQFFMAPISNAVDPVKEGKLVALGVSSEQRDPLVPGVPTIAEAGVPGYQWVLWYGLLASAKTPRSIITLLNRKIAGILGQAEVRARWFSLGLEPKATTPAAFDGLIDREIARFAKMARAADIRAH